MTSEAPVRRCPSCGKLEHGSVACEHPGQEIVAYVPDDGSDHLDYIRKNFEHIPDFMWDSVAHAMNMAGMWIKEHKGA